MKRVAELEHEPEVGKYYLVPCIDYHGRWLPVLGTEHEDSAIIGFANHHWHSDLRFLPDRMIESASVGRKLSCTPEQFMMARVTIDLTHQLPVERKMRCRRLTPVFPLVPVGSSAFPWMPALENAYKDVKLNCARCPHRGFPLSADNADEHGNVVCAGHGLMWNLESGRLVSRLANLPDAASAETSNE
jgi:hypothetical protein